MLYKSDFKAPWYLRNSHLQTLTAGLLRQAPAVSYQRQRIELPDGDFVDLDWTQHYPKQPLLLLFHGLEGSSRSPYAAGIAQQTTALGINFAVVHSRNCSGEPNRLARAYHAGETQDMAYVIDQLSAQFPAIAAVGYSLGANALLKWLGESAEKNPLKAAAAVSTPFVLKDGSERFKRGFSRLYERHLLSALKRSQTIKVKQGLLPISEKQLLKIQSLYEFDDQLTGPLHGFKSADEYYRINSCRQYLKHITTPTLILHAKDDPFMYPHSMPNIDELSSAIRLEWSEKGGHVGFISTDRSQRYWLESRLLRWTQQALLNNDEFK